MGNKCCKSLPQNQSKSELKRIKYRNVPKLQTSVEVDAVISTSSKAIQCELLANTTPVVCTPTTAEPSPTVITNKFTPMLCQRLNSPDVGRSRGDEPCESPFQPSPNYQTDYNSARVSPPKLCSGPLAANPMNCPYSGTQQLCHSNNIFETGINCSGLSQYGSSQYFNNPGNWNPETFEHRGILTSNTNANIRSPTLGSTAQTSAAEFNLTAPIYMNYPEKTTYDQLRLHPDILVTPNTLDDKTPLSSPPMQSTYSANNIPERTLSIPSLMQCSSSQNRPLAMAASNMQPEQIEQTKKLIPPEGVREVRRTRSYSWSMLCTKNQIDNPPIVPTSQLSAFSTTFGSPASLFVPPGHLHATIREVIPAFNTFPTNSSSVLVDQQQSRIPTMEEVLHSNTTNRDVKHLNFSSNPSSWELPACQNHILSANSYLVGIRDVTPRSGSYSKCVNALENDKIPTAWFPKFVPCEYIVPVLETSIENENMNPGSVIRPDINRLVSLNQTDPVEQNHITLLSDTPQTTMQQESTTAPGLVVATHPKEPQRNTLGSFPTTPRHVQTTHFLKDAITHSTPHGVSGRAGKRTRSASHSDVRKREKNHKVDLEAKQKNELCSERTDDFLKHRFFLKDSCGIDKVLADPADRRIRAICDRYQCDLEVYSKIPKNGYLQYIIDISSPSLWALNSCTRALDSSLNWCLSPQLIHATSAGTFIKAHKARRKDYPL